MLSKTLLKKVIHPNASATKACTLAFYPRSTSQVAIKSFSTSHKIEYSNMDVLQTVADWEAKVTNNPKTVIVQASAKWCQPCESMKPAMQNILDENKDEIDWVYVDIEEQSEIASQYDIDHVPKVLVYRNGKLLDQISGLHHDFNALNNLLDLSMSDDEGSSMFKNESIVDKVTSEEMSASKMVSDFYSLHLQQLPVHNYKFIGAGVGTCAGVVGCQYAPNIVKDLLGLESTWNSTIPFHGDERHLDAMDNLAQFSRDLALTTSEIIKSNKKFITIGGDHSCGIGTWTGVHDALGSDYGLIWIDAHMDSHTPDSSPSGNMHGMPVASLLGYGHKKLTQILSEEPKLKPENIVFIGIRSYEGPEEELLKKLGVKVFYNHDVNEKGFEHCFKHALDTFEKKDLKFGISFDLDGLDPEYIDALGTPEDDGIHLPDIENAFPTIPEDRFIGIEVVEYNPTIDTDNRGVKVIKRILEAIPNLTYKNIE